MYTPKRSIRESGGGAKGDMTPSLFLETNFILLELDIENKILKELSPPFLEYAKMLGILYIIIEGLNYFR